MACLINNTNKPIKTSVWTLLQDTFGPDDAKWIAGIGAFVHVDHPTHTFNTQCGGQHTVAGKPRIEITTTTDKQRDMLMLKYGDKLIKLSEVLVLPHSTTEFRTFR